MPKQFFKLPPTEFAKYALVGSGKVMASFANLLLERNFPKPILVTWKKEFHQRDIKLLNGNSNYINIFEFAKKKRLKLFEVNNVNDPCVLKKLKKNGIKLIFSLSSRWIFKKNMINEFEGLVFNIHSGTLPRDRGSVVYQKILNNIKSLGVTIHIVNPSVDAGPIILQSKKTIDINTPTIDNITSIHNKMSLDLLAKFLTIQQENKKFKLSEQNIGDGIYMPQLYTELNGYIDWRWTAEEIERFIRAFGKPLPGAMTFYKRKKIKIFGSTVQKSDIKFHPFYIGRIINIDAAGDALIITSNNFLKVTSISIDDKVIKPGSYLKEPNVLYTPMNILEKASTKSVSSLNMRI